MGSSLVGPPPWQVIRDLTPATENDLIWEWVRAEVDIPDGDPRVHRRQQHGLDSRLLDVLAAGRKESLAEGDWGRLRDAYLRLRGSYLGPLLGPGTRWAYGEIPVPDLREIRLPNLTISFVPLAPTRRLEEFVRALDQGKETPGDQFSSVYRRRRPTFDLVRARGRPVLIAERDSGPYVLAEGLTRVSVLVSRRAHGESVPDTLPVMLGTSPQARLWPWW